MINFVSVVSSDIQAIAIDGADLVIKFNTGSIYKYVNAAREFNNLLGSSSKGTYFHQNIKKNYVTIRVL